MSLRVVHANLERPSRHARPAMPADVQAHGRRYSRTSPIGSTRMHELPLIHTGGSTRMRELTLVHTGERPYSHF